jgi:hypothetical protein
MRQVKSMKSRVRFLVNDSLNVNHQNHEDSCLSIGENMTIEKIEQYNSTQRIVEEVKPR